MSPRTSSTAEYVEDLQQRGVYSFSADDALSETSEPASRVHQALTRLAAKKRIARVRRDYFVIVPLEYLTAGAPPPSWYIHQLMAYLNCDYYVGLLSAASIHGASHQKPQEFQVIGAKQLPPRLVAGSRLRFFRKSAIKLDSVVPVKTETGFMNVSTAELTALDLVHFRRAVGGINNVADILAESWEKLDAGLLAAEAAKLSEKATAQRLGYLLDYLGAESRTSLLHEWVVSQDAPYAALERTGSVKHKPRDDKWHLYLTIKVEVDR